MRDEGCLTMKMQRFRIPQKAWYGDTDLELMFPASFTVHYHSMPVEDRPRLTHEGMRKAFQEPIGTRPISELARGKKNVIEYQTTKSATIEKILLGSMVLNVTPIVVNVTSASPTARTAKTSP